MPTRYGLTSQGDVGNHRDLKGRQALVSLLQGCILVASILQSWIGLGPVSLTKTHHISINSIFSSPVISLYFKHYRTSSVTSRVGYNFYHFILNPFSKDPEHFHRAIH